MYTCRDCGKRTRDTGNDEAGVELCRACYVAAGIENEHNDGWHTDNPHPDCPDCQAGKVSTATTGREIKTPAQVEAPAPAPEAEHGEHVHHEPGCGLCESERLAAEPVATIADLRQLADRMRGIAIDYLKGQQQKLQAMVAAQTDRDFAGIDCNRLQQDVTYADGRIDAWQRAAEEVEQLIARLAR